MLTFTIFIRRKINIKFKNEKKYRPLTLEDEVTKAKILKKIKRLNAKNTLPKRKKRLVYTLHMVRMY